MQKLQELRDRINKGFYYDNLIYLAGLCRGMALDSPTPAIYFVLEKIFQAVADDWEDRPVVVEEAQELTEQMIASVRDLILAIDANETQTELFSMINAVVSAYISYLKH